MADNKEDTVRIEPYKDVKSIKDACEEEVNLMFFFAVLVRRKWFILFSSLLPALITAAFFIILPKDYKAAFVYDVNNWNLNEKNYNIMLSRFYSEENLERLKDKIQSKCSAEQVKGLNSKGKRPSMVINFEVLPPYLNIPKITSNIADDIEKIRNIPAQMLKVTITCQSKEELRKISPVILDNIKEVLLLYSVKDELSALIKEYNNKLAEIERNRFSFGLELRNNNGILAGLKSINAAAAERKDNIVFQLDVGNHNDYLPLSYQIQAAESNTVRLAERIKTNEEQYKYYSDLLGLINAVLNEVDNNMSSGYKPEKLKMFVANLSSGSEKQELKDYLSSYARSIENKIASSVPVAAKPEIYTVSRGAAKKSGAVFAAFLVLSVCGAFLLERTEKIKFSVNGR